MTTYPLPKPAYTRIGFDATIGDTPSLRTSVPATVSGVEVFTAAQMQAAYAAGFAAAVPDGWKLAPVEPTNFQTIKGENALHSISHGDFHATQAEIESCYVAMIAAKALPPISNEDRRWLSDNPNTSDIVEWIRGYANLAITEVLAEPAGDIIGSTRTAPTTVLNVKQFSVPMTELNGPLKPAPRRLTDEEAYELLQPISLKMLALAAEWADNHIHRYQHAMSVESQLKHLVRAIEARIFGDVK